MCNSNNQPTLQHDNSINNLEAAKLLLDAWKFRQGHAWSSLTRYYLAAVSVSIVPYIIERDLAVNLHPQSGWLQEAPHRGALT